MMRLIFRPTLNPLVLAGAMLLLSGCGLFSGDGGSIEGWYEDAIKKHQNQNTNKVIVPVKPFNIISFQGETRDPFEARNLIQVSTVVDEEIDRFAPNPDRLREPLETYPIATLSFVGTILQKEPDPNIALVSAAGSLYQVKIGNYLGPDFGLVVQIRETEIVLEETVKNARGRWERKERTINLAGLQKEALR